MYDNRKIFVLPGWAHDRVFDTTGVGVLSGYQGAAMQGYYARKTGAVWKTCDKQALIMAEIGPEQLARVGAPLSTNGS